MAATRLQTKVGNGGGYVTSMNLAFTSNVTAGSMIIVIIYHGAGQTITSVTDNQGNTYNLLDTGAGPYGGGSAFYAYNVTGGSVTVTINASDYAYLTVVMREYGGLTTTDPLDKKVEQLDGSYLNSHPLGTTATTTQNNELVCAYYVADDSVPDASFSIAGFSNKQTTNNGTYGAVLLADKDQTSTGTQTGTVSTGARYTNCWGGIATFKEAAAPAATVKQLAAMGVG